MAWEGLHGVKLSTNEYDFILSGVQDAERVDGRRAFDQRHVDITCGTDYGHVQVSLGKTKVLAVVSAELTEPYPDRPVEGFIAFTAEMTPMSAPECEPTGPAHPLAIEISMLLERHFRAAGAVDTEALCVIAGEVVWSVRCDIKILDYAGNAIDAANLAAAIALRHFRRPEIDIIDGQVSLREMRESHPVPLLVHHTPLSVTFAFFSPTESGECAEAVVDPSLVEEKAATGRLTMTMTYQKEVCGIHKSSALAVTQTQVLKLANLAAKKAFESHQMIEKVLEQDRKNRERAILQRKGDGVSLSSIVALDVDNDTGMLLEGSDDEAGTGDRLFNGGIESSVSKENGTDQMTSADADMAEFARVASQLSAQSGQAETVQAEATVAGEGITDSGDGRKGSKGSKGGEGKTRSSRATASSGDLSAAIKKKPKKKKK